jgi:hypothetical protein
MTDARYGGCLCLRRGSVVAAHHPAAYADQAARHRLFQWKKQARRHVDQTRHPSGWAESHVVEDAYHRLDAHLVTECLSLSSPRQRPGTGRTAWVAGPEGRASTHQDLTERSRHSHRGILTEVDTMARQVEHDLARQQPRLGGRHG